MTPRDKAKKLVDLMRSRIVTSWHSEAINREGLSDSKLRFIVDQQAKSCANLLVDEIISEGATQYGSIAVDNGREKFWLEVKNQINL